MTKAKGGIGVYVRVSSRSQSCDSQRPDLEKWIKANANGAPVTWFEDVFTGRTMERPGFTKMSQEIEAGRIKTVLVWRLNRLGRTTSGLVSYFDYLCSKAVNLVSIKDSFDLHTPHGKMIASIIASISEYDNEIRREAQHAGIIAAKEANGGKVPWGGSRQGRVILPQEKIDAIRDLHKSGTKISEIARLLGVSRPSIYKFVSPNP